MILRIITNKFVITPMVIVLTGLSAAAVLANRGGTGVEISTLAVTRGDVVETVSATGTLEAVTTVQIGAQVSGNIQALFADFNSIVHKGQLLARIEPTALQSQVDQARAAVVKAEAEVERLKVALDDVDLDLARTRKLAERQIAAPSDLDAAVVARRTAEVQLKSADASVVQVRAALSQAEVNLAKTAIFSPIDGIVVSRDVDIGQTVAASMSAPTLFLLAADLTHMRVNASIDESDVGRIAAGQTVKFTVDAFPSEPFAGTVAQVRMSPTVTQNVVTYQTIIDVPNPELKLRPGMTANVTVETKRRDNVLRAPNAAVRFKPTTEMLALLGQADPGATAGMTSTAPAKSTRFTPAAPGSPATGRVWVLVDGTLTPLDVRLGVTDGTHTEIVSSALAEGTELVWGVTESSRSSTQNATRSTYNPLLGSQPRMMPGGGSPPPGPPPGD
jgi:HlyD family secretion protein